MERDACLHAYNCTGQNKNIYKVQYRVWCTKVGSLADVADVGNKSAECNFVQLVSSTTVAPTHDWSDFFATQMKKVVSIKKLHHFKISSLFPSKVFVKEHNNSGEVTFDVLKGPWTSDTDELPTVIPQPGLTPDRQWYLYNSICRLCQHDYKDTTCTVSLIPWLSASRGGTPNPDLRPSSTVSEEAQMTCVICNEEGDNKQSWS